MITCAGHQLQMGKRVYGMTAQISGFTHGKGKVEPQAGFAMWIPDRSWMPTVPTTSLQSVTLPHSAALQYFPQ